MGGVLTLSKKNRSGRNERTQGRVHCRYRRRGKRVIATAHRRETLLKENPGNECSLKIDKNRAKRHHINPPQRKKRRKHLYVGRARERHNYNT